jgi:uncharacterized membrane protein YhaH (DUF805 family)
MHSFLYFVIHRIYSGDTIIVMNETIQTYISTERARGVTDSAITEALLAQGWKKEDAESALNIPATPVSGKHTGGMFSGRLGRTKYVPIVIVSHLFMFTLSFSGIYDGPMIKDLFHQDPIRWGLMMGIFSLVTIPFIVAFLGVTVRRLHDTGYSGWWALLSLLNPLGLILTIFLCFKGGDAGANTYGSIPDVNMSYWHALRGS